MTKLDSTSPPASGKPAKPRPDFPLTPHPNGRWCKKVKGKLYYFGRWADPDAALAEYLEQKDRLHAGLTTTDNCEALTLFRLSAEFLKTKKAMRDAGELSVHSWNDYVKTCQRLLKVFGKNRLVVDLRPNDFQRLRVKLAASYGPVRLGNEINKTRIVFNYAFKNGLLERPMVFGEGFRRPSKKTLRKHRAAQGPKMFSADEIRAMLKKAGQPLKAMFLLGINAGYGNNDVGTLPLSALDLTGGWLSHARPKTGIARRCPLWPETVKAVRAWLLMRPAPKKEELTGLVFLTGKGDSWAKDTSDNPVSKETRKLLDSLGINGHRNFYCLRHTLQTVGDEARDFLAVRHIMGHVGADIADAYREKISDERLRAVAEHVRGWLFASAAKPKTAGKAKSQAKAPATNENSHLRLFTA